MSGKPTVSEVLALSKDEIISKLGDIYEHSSWIAEEFYSRHLDVKGQAHGIENVRDLFQAMNSIMQSSSDERKLSLLCAHPDLCAKIDQLKTLTKSSQEEQSSAGLGTMTDEERNKFSNMNSSYREKFGFPFILAARNATKFTVLSAIEGRLNLSKETEFSGALYQVSKIAWMRLLAAFDLKGCKGFLTCHVLDTGNGCPAAGMRVKLTRLSPVDRAGFVKEFVTNSDGRLDGPALKDDEFIVGIYEWTFYAGDYFARSNTKISGMPFLDVIPLRFGIDDPEEHYHVPLLISNMKFNYKLHRLCGSVYGTPNATNSTSSGGNIVYTSSGNVILSPVSNRIQVIDLLTHTVRTLSCEARSNVKTIALSPDDKLLIIVDVNNHAMLVNFHRSVILHRFSFKRDVKVCNFSPCGLFFTVSYGNHVQVWHSPGLRREFSPFVLHRTYTGLGDNVSSICWSYDSSVIMASCRNGTVRIWTVNSVEGYEPFTLSGHKSAVVGAYFEKITPGTGNRLRKVYTVSADGALVSWISKYSDEDKDENLKERQFLESSNAALNFFGGANDNFFGTATKAKVDNHSTQAEYLPKATWEVIARHYFHQEADVTATNFEPEHNLLIVGFGSGIFGLYELPSMSNIHTLSLSNQIIRTVAINKTGEWLAFGCPSTQQLLVWEWRSETYVIKQRGHAYGMRCMAYSKDGVVVATGGEDGSIKLWNTSSGFCYCTLKSHTAPITAITFSNSSVVMSASLDGTVRAHDLNRYRNFRTFTTPQPCQFTSLAVDPSGEVLVAGTMDPFHIYTWNIQSSKLLDVLTGHIGPISQLSFHPLRGTLASSSWDGTVKLWDLYKREGEPESLKHSHDVVCCAFRPDGKEMCTGTIGGILSIWNVDDGKLLFEIDGKRDIAGGRKVNDRMTADNNAASRYFTSVCYSADGSCILAGGNSKYICIYEVSQQILVKKFQVSFNRSLDGILDELNSKSLADGGPIDVNFSGDDADFSANLPGARRGDDGSRKSKVEVITMQVAFSNTGREWATVSNEGLHVYSLDDDMIFDPIALTEEITPGSVQSNLRSGNHSVALLISLHLNEYGLVRQVIEETPFASIPHVVKSVGNEHLERLMQFIAKSMSDSPHLEFYIQWSLEMLKIHGLFLEKHRNTYMSAFRAMHRSVHNHHNALKRICDENRYTLDYVEDQMQMTLDNANI